MPTNQPVAFKHVFAIIKTRGTFLGIGLVFIVLAGVMTPLIAHFNNTKNAYEKYDHEKIMASGKDLVATISNVDIQYNITINTVNHPMVITYSYEDNGQPRTDQFKTLINSEESTLQVGDSIPIKAYRDQSVLKDFEPFSFPIYLLYFVPGLTCLVGIVLLLVALIPAIKYRQLYKNGQRTQATIIALTAASSLPVLSARNHVKVSYLYPGSNGNRIIGTSISPGLHLLAEKKPQDSIDIFVSPRNENVSCVVPKELL